MAADRKYDIRFCFIDDFHTCGDCHRLSVFMRAHDTEPVIALQQFLKLVNDVLIVFILADDALIAGIVAAVGIIQHDGHRRASALSAAYQLIDRQSDDQHKQTENDQRKLTGLSASCSTAFLCHDHMTPLYSSSAAAALISSIIRLTSVSIFSPSV